ncbi:two-component sensor histidine kinase [Sporosarcina sp. P12(2017)]|uniref:sensor histidine kinase n=1 Tax=unclassified Sporosarcina TaxID=2647733 RepID=UPI000C169D4E|nr:MULTISPECIES: HAMP domain-containing sensor histidine kinase [unclassified Sporosarcina]PIC58024.1 two-component sensor histidine kinase [Sporosarcina sp. P10]PIC59441.1 two-component sensor histidine kinase [Sporosarcina sp. P12(2017)]
MNKISTKLAASFIISFLILDALLMIYLHQTITHARVDEELDRLLKTGSNHRNVLEDNYTETTLHHIILMESGGERDVAILDDRGNIVQHSLENEEILIPYISELNEKQLAEDTILPVDWKKSPYLVSVHPYEATGNSGALVMLQSTIPIRQLVNQLNVHFLLAGGGSIVVLFVVYLLLSKWLTRPLIRMKEATEQMSEGLYDVDLPKLSNDELGELAASIRKLSNDLSRVKRERKEFLASVSHEMGTPLTYLIGYAKVAQRTELNDTERFNYLSIIEEEAERLKTLVKNLMDLAQMDEMTFTVTKSEFAAEEFIRDIVQLVQPSFDLKGITLRIEQVRDFPIVADRMRLEQIILNLLDNALHYSETSSTVIIRAFQDKKHVLLQVEDSGCGIAVENQQQIFEKLYRVEKSRSRSFGGAGLGLATVKELTEAHGGTIEVESELDQGSIFTVRLY